MARKTIKKPNKRLGQTRRRVRRNTPAPVPAPAPAVSESQRFVSSMTFDGNTLVTKTQKNNEPVNEQIYTMDQLAQDLPIGKELIDIHLDGKMPRQLQEHHHHRKRMKPMFNNVLLHPADLGLLAPNVELSKPDKLRSLRRGRRHSARHSRDDNMRLMVSDADDDAGVQYKRPRNLFDLP